MRALAAQLPNMHSWRATLAYLYAEDGNEAGAREALESLAGKGFADLARDATWLTTMGLLAEVAAFLGDAERARLLAALLAPYADRAIVLGPALSVLSAVARPLALALAASGQRPAACRGFERALTVEQRLGARCLIARTRQQYSAVLATGSAAERERALELASAALSDADAIGMRAVASRARALVEDLSGVTRLRADPERKLSPR
jgi:hypothetical protein